MDDKMKIPLETKEYIKTPITEEEQPFEQTKMINASATRLVEIEQKEADKNRKEKRYFKSFNFLYFCLIMLFIIYGIDLAVNIIVNSENSSIAPGLIEIVKALLFTVSGYIFGKKSEE